MTKLVGAGHQHNGLAVFKNNPNMTKSVDPPLGITAIAPHME